MSTTNELLDSAKCIGNCIPAGMQLPVLIHLFNEIAAGCSAATCTYQTGIGDPAGVLTPDFVGQLYHDTDADEYYRSTGTTSADWTIISGGGGPCANVEGAGDPT